MSTTGGELLALARETLGDGTVVEFEREVCVGLRCADCGTYEQRFGALSRITEEEARCDGCGNVRDPELTHALYGHEEYLDRPLAQLGLPPYDVVTFRNGVEMRHFLLAEDRELAMGKIARLGVTSHG